MIVTKKRGGRVPSPLGGGWLGQEGEARRGVGPVSEELTSYARHLRQTMTDAERRLWRELRRDALGVRFRRQVPIGRRKGKAHSYAGEN